MQSQAASLGVTLKVFDAAGNANQQAADMNTMISQSYDVIFLSPVDETSLNTSIVAARKACIPVFLLDRDVNHTQAVPGTDYVSFLGSDFVQEGNRVANWLMSKWDFASQGNIVVLELLGTTNSSPAIGRQNGFENAVAANANASRVSYAAKVDGNFTRSTANAIVNPNIATYSPAVNFIYAHNDEMGLGALDALTNMYGNPNNTIPPSSSQFANSSVKPGNTIWIGSMDGESETITDIAAGVYNVMVTCSPRFGPLAFQTLQSYLSGATVPTWTVVQDTLVDSSNASTSTSLGF